MFSSSQVLELFVVLCTASVHCRMYWKAGSAFIHAEANAGPARPKSVPKWNVPFSALQAITWSLISMIYIFSVAGAGLQQPAWMKAIALPGMVFGIRLEGTPQKNALRVLACVASISSLSIQDSVFEHLGDQYHPIGRREKSRVVQTGPFAWVRHPLYALGLLHTVFQSIAHWSYAHLFALIVLAAILVVKIHIEEEAILRDDAIKEEYRAYMRKVPARLVLYVW